MFPDSVPYNYHVDCVDVDQVTLAISDLAPFTKEERRMITAQMVDKQWVPFDEEKFYNPLNSKKEVVLNSIQIKNLITFLQEKANNDVHFTVASDDETESHYFIVGTKQDRSKINKKVIGNIRRNLEYIRKDKKEKADKEKDQKEKHEKLYDLFTKLTEKKMTFEEFQKDTTGLLECVKFVQK